VPEHNSLFVAAAEAALPTQRIRFCGVLSEKTMWRCCEACVVVQRTNVVVLERKRSLTIIQLSIPCAQDGGCPALNWLYDAANLGGLGSRNCPLNHSGVGGAGQSHRDKPNGENRPKNRICLQPRL